MRVTLEDTPYLASRQYRVYLDDTSVDEGTYEWGCNNFDDGVTSDIDLYQWDSVNSEWDWEADWTRQNSDDDGAMATDESNNYVYFAILREIVSLDEPDCTFTIRVATMNSADYKMDTPGGRDEENDPVNMGTSDGKYDNTLSETEIPEFSTLVVPIFCLLTMFVIFRKKRGYYGG